MPNSVCLVLALSIAAPLAAQDRSIPRWTRFEEQFTAAAEYRNAVQEVSFEVEFTAPSGAKITVPGFWDGQRLWKVRFSPEETGRWTWRTRCSRQDDSGLNQRTGSFECVPYAGDNPLYRHGAVRLSKDRRYLVQDDGTPFFWLGDTAWTERSFGTERGTGAANRGRR